MAAGYRLMASCKHLQPCCSSSSGSSTCWFYFCDRTHVSGSGQRIHIKSTAWCTVQGVEVLIAFDHVCASVCVLADAHFVFGHTHRHTHTLHGTTVYELANRAQSGYGFGMCASHGELQVRSAFSNLHLIHMHEVINIGERAHATDWKSACTVANRRCATFAAGQ